MDWVRVNLLVVVLGISPPAFAGGLYKCVAADGTQTFQQVPCRGAQTQENLEVDTRTIGGGAAGSDGYSVMEQMREIDKRERAKARERKARSQRAQERDPDRDAQLREKQARYDEARCRDYREQVDDQQDRLRDSYVKRSDRTSAEKRLRYLELQVARYCDD